MRNSQHRSYRNDSSRIYQKNLKHPTKQINLIATICLDWDDPVPYWELNEEYTDGSIYVHFVSDRTLSRHIKWDIQDRHKSHQATNANIERGDPTVAETYEEIGIVQDFTPAGNPQFDPIESLFSKIDKDLSNAAPEFNKGHGWDMNDMENIIQKSLESATFKNVQAWYRRTWTELYNGRSLPVYLCEDITKENFVREIVRLKGLAEGKEETDYITRSGRVSRQQNK